MAAPTPSFARHGIARRVSYPLLGTLLALGSPIGLMLIRCRVALPSGFAACAARQLASDAETYGYLQLSTSIVFAALGFWLGRREDRLRLTAGTDALTGLANRGAFEARCREAIAQATRYHTPLALLMIDLDGLKHINDRDGHAAGDRAIHIVAEALARTARAADTPGRIGGDEFAVLAPGTSAEQSERLAARIHAALHETTPQSITVSIGIADLDAVGTATMASLFRCADAALYEAKHAGRNRTAAYSPASKPPAS